MRSALIIGCACAWACQGPAGEVDLRLSLPSDSTLRPTGMTQISVIAQSPTIGTITDTSLLGGGTTVTAGDLPVGSDVMIDVLFRDDSSRLVGVGEAESPIDIVGDQTVSLTMPVRRPFVYASSGSALYSFDPTLDPRDAAFQGTLGGVSQPQLAISVGGAWLVVAGPSSVQVIETDTNMPVGGPIAIPGTIADAAPVPGTHLIAVAHSAGISIVDLDSDVVTSASGPAVDRITVGPDGHGGQIATGLVGRVAPPASATDTCTGTSQIVTAEIATPPKSLDAMPLSDAIADIAASPDDGTVYAALPCAGEVASLSSAGLSQISALSRAAVVAVAGEHVWAAGTAPSQPMCEEGNTDVACATGQTAACTGSDPNANIVYVSDGAHLIVQAIPLDGAGSDAVSVDIPEPRETIISTDDPGGQHAQVLKSLAMTPVDLVALPGNENVAVVTQTRYFIQSLVQQDFSGNLSVLLPCLDVTTGDWQLFDFASTSVAQRVRTVCDLTVGPVDTDTTFKNWACEDAPDGQQPTQGDYLPISVGALFGAR